jgi:hypothetical protein
MGEESNKLIEMVKQRIPDKEIMEKLGIKTKTTLKRMYYDALVEAGKIKDIVSKHEDVGVKKILKVGKRGTISLNKKLVIEEFGFKEGDKFSVYQRKDSIILKKEQD